MGHTDVAHHVALKMKTKEDRQLLFEDLYQSWDEELTASERFGFGTAIVRVPLFLSLVAVWPMLSAEAGTLWQLGNVAFASSTLALAVHWEQKRRDAQSRAEYLDEALVNVENIQGYFKDDVHACEMMQEGMLQCPSGQGGGFKTHCRKTRGFEPHLQHIARLFHFVHTRSTGSMPNRWNTVRRAVCTHKHSSSLLVCSGEPITRQSRKKSENLTATRKQ